MNQQEIDARAERRKRTEILRHRDFAIRVDRPTWRRLCEVARNHDVNNNGLYDARSGAINIWCSPTEKPSCWNIEVTQGGLDYPRAFVGSLITDDFKSSDPDTWGLFLDASPYDLVREASPGYSNFDVITEEQWASIMDWLEAECRILFQLAGVPWTRS